jgi:hypothetical protein
MPTSLWYFFLLNEVVKLVDRLELSYKTANELNDLIDNELHGHTLFECKELVIGNECLEFHCHDILSCIRGLFSDPAFACDLIFSPEQLYTNRERTERVYNKVNTGNWWWAVQVRNEMF